MLADIIGRAPFLRRLVSGQNFISMKIGTILALSYLMSGEPATLKMVLNFNIQHALQACSWQERTPEIHNAAISQPNG